MFDPFSKGDFMYNNKTVAAVIVAGGNSTRMKSDKMLIPLLGRSVISRTVSAFSDCGFFDEIILVSSAKNTDIFAREMKNYNLSVKITEGGKTRGESSFRGICTTESEFVMIHDGARALITEDIIKATLDACICFGGSAPVVTPKDTIKRLTPGGTVECTVERSLCGAIQTPQAFNTKLIKEAYEKYGYGETDDCAVAEKAGIKIKTVMGSYENIKLTTPEDILSARQILLKRNGRKEQPSMRIGTGFDSHRLTEGRDLIIGGTHIPYEKGLLGHSDADVLIHAVIDALFGGAALGDIGTHFPDTDEAFRGISSMLLLKKAAQKVREAGFEIGNVDTTLIAQNPKMAPYIASMRENLARAMNIDISCVSVKAKSNEHMGFTGRGEGIEARATALLYL